jgi:hypothetical protein
MALQRIKGQEVTFSVVRDGNPTPIGVAQSVTITVDIERLEEEYIGETSMNYDSVYNGTQIESDLHLENDEFLSFIEAVKQRAERRAGGALRVDAAVTLVFPTGIVRQILLINLESAELPIEVGSRKDYVSLKVDMKTNQLKFL